MPDLRIGVKGDLAGLQAFDQAVRASVQGNTKALAAANRSIASKVAPITGIYDPKSQQAGLFLRNAKTTVDTINKSFIQTGELIRTTIAGYKGKLDEAGKFRITPILDKQYEGTFQKIIGDLGNYEKALKDLAPVEEQYLKRQLDSERRVGRLQEKAFKANAQKELAQQKSDEFIKSQRLLQAGNQKVINSPTATATDVRNAITRNEKLDDSIAKSKTKTASIIAELDKEIAQLTRKWKQLEAAQKGRLTRFQKTPEFLGARSAAEEVPPINLKLQQALRDSRDLEKTLLRTGLGGGVNPRDVAGFRAALAQQEAAVTSYTENVRNNVRTIRGHFTDLNTGVLKEFTFDIDKNGKVIQRWGGQLAGAGNIIRQTVRDFQKVIEWTVATTLVFGTLAAVVSQLQSINELNADLTRLAITSEATSEEMKSLFTGLGNVAIETATPLTEIISAADDIALATRNANQSTEEWHKSIIELTKSVGIYTNLAGVDTVEATDQLSAAFKQLGIAPTDILGILSKITAVSGGQAGAIKDIVSGVSGLAESARAAGLTVDEQIASIQVLSQVTNKSSSEITTAFKNLFGSISSVGSEKILAEFGINVRDATGGVKDFLVIYREIRDALDKGIIPQERLPDVLRGISGGPRRAPDAAALLSNLPRINEVVTKSQNATNDALIANAKILDTNSAKITQFQNAIDIAVFEKFGGAIKDLLTFLTDLGTTIAQVFGSFDTNVVKVLVQLGALFLAAKAIGGILRLMGIENLSAALGRLAASFKATTVEAKSFGTVTQTISSSSATGPVTGTSKGVLGRFGLNKAKIAGLGLAAAGTAGLAVAGGLNTNSIGTALQLGGSLVALIPGLQAVGVTALLAGTALQLVAGNSEKTKESQHALAVEMDDLIRGLKDARDTADGFSDAQKDAKATIDTLLSKTQRTAEEETRLATAQNEYAKSSIGLAEANLSVADSIDEILKKLPGLEGESYKAFQSLTKGKLLDTETLKKFQALLSESILEATGQQIYKGTPATISPNFVPNTREAPSTITVVRNRARQELNFEDLITDPTKIKDFYLNGKLNVPPTALSQTNIGLLQSALTRLPELIEKGQGNGITEAQITEMVDALNRLTIGLDTYTNNLAAIAQTRAKTQANVALGLFTQEQGKNADVAVNLIEKLNEAQQRYVNNPPRLPTFRSPDAEDRAGNPAAKAFNEQLAKSQKLMHELQVAAAAGLGLTNRQLIEAAKNTLIENGLMEDLAKAGEGAVNYGIYESIKAAIGPGEQLDSIMNDLGVSTRVVAENAAEIAAAIQDATDAAKRSALQTFAQRQLEIEIAQNAGEYDENPKQYEIDKNKNKVALDANNELIDSFKELDQDGLQQVIDTLTQFVGLQGEYITQAEIAAAETEGQAAVTALFAGKVNELSAQLIANALAAGVDAEGIERVKTEVLDLQSAIISLATYKHILIEIETRYTGAQMSVGDIIAQNAEKAEVQKKIDAATKKEEEARAKYLKEIQSAVIPQTGTPKAPKPPDVSTLDIPDALRKLNQEGLLSDSQLLADIQQAYKTAAKLQKLIPGYDKEAKDDIVEILNGTKRLAEFRGVKEELLRKALEELADIEKKRLEFETKADTIRRIRLGIGDFSGLVNLPLNRQTGVSVGSPEGPITVNLNINGQILTPAQMSQVSEQVGAAIKRSIAG